MRFAKRFRASFSAPEFAHACLDYKGLKKLSKKLGSDGGEEGQYECRRHHLQEQNKIAIFFRSLPSTREQDALSLTAQSPRSLTPKTHPTALAEFDALLRSELEKVDRFYADKEAEIEVGRKKKSSLARYPARSPRLPRGDAPLSLLRFFASHHLRPPPPPSLSPRNLLHE